VDVISNGLINKPSEHSVDETVTRLQQLVQAKSLTLFALIDHSGEAAKVGLSMRPTRLLIFGSPAAGTPLMLAAPSVAIDLPLKILVWEDDDGHVWVTYTEPTWLKARHRFPDDLLRNIAGIEALATKAAE